MGLADSNCRETLPVAFSSAMAQHTPPQPDEHISMELEDSAIGATAPDPAAAAAAAVLATLPQPPAAAAVTGAVSRRAVRASARRGRSGVEPLFSLLPIILFRCAVHCILFSRYSLLQRLARFGLRGKPAAVGLCCQFSTCSRTMSVHSMGIRH